MPETVPVNISSQAKQAKMRLGIVGNTPALNQAVERAIMVAPIDLSVLIIGESGTGKEFFPQIIHQYSARKHSKYIAVNCGAIPEGTIDSELFGHEKGSFTGAVSERKGYFEEANGGTIFLDEVAELPLTTQARLLRVLESGEFLKVGSSTVQRTNIRVVAATNVDMAKAVAEGRFREDLFYRLSTVQISIPPLRDRGQDIQLLARKFAADFSEKYRMPGISLADDAKRLLMAYRWPGNVRQLKNVVEQMALFEAGREIDAASMASYLPLDAPSITSSSPTVRHSANAYSQEREMLFNMILRLQSEISELRQRIDSMEGQSSRLAPAPPQFPTSLVKIEHAAPALPRHPSVIDVDANDISANHQPADAQPHSTLEENERALISEALARNDGRRKMAAKELNISERTLYRKIKEYGLD
ncbi:MAG: sigma 54-interacting transcriptional regulator [Clostridium sp.]|nr:sigma 54-interacting transcriptional regulator [Clostridium sp.]